MSPAKLTISQVADLLGIPAKTIRHYHEIGVLPEPERAENGYRLYTGADLRKLQTIRELQSFGLTLKQVQYVLSSDEPDVHLRAFLLQRDEKLADEIHNLQQQQARVRATLNGNIANVARQTPSHEILHQVVKAVSNSLADVLLEVETHILTEIDQLPHHPDYALFWEQVGTMFARSIQPNEHQFMLWMERYLALPTMMPDDRQAQAWLSELCGSADSRLLASAFDLPETDALPQPEQLHIRRLLPMLLYEHASPVQKMFLAALKREDHR